MHPNKRPLVLMILDGFGYSPNTAYNAIYTAKTPQWDAWWAHYPHLLLAASGESVGLPSNQMGNSEVGHMHIGAGRVILQELSLINNAIQQKHFYTNPVFIKTLTSLKQSQHALHIMGLLSDGGVHSHIDHLLAFLDLCIMRDFQSIYLHLFLDGRDTPPKSATQYIKRLQAKLKQLPNAKIASISGRYYAMDRDQRWERTQPVYDLIVTGHAEHYAQTVDIAIARAYQQGLSDEFIPPTQIGESHPLCANDAIFFFNFRADRARQLTAVFLDKNTLKLQAFISMTEYAKTLATQVAFPKQTLHNTFGEVIAEAGLRQLRLAETEKYAHVTFFFNGGIETCFAGETRVLIPSPKVRTYDLQPEMSAQGITQTLIDAILSKTYDVIICNYANADMVGHTGDFNATVLAIETLDKAMHAVWMALKTVNGRLFITADHGNAECMFDEQTQQPHTAHTQELVPFLCIDPNMHLTTTHGSLSDIAPTLLQALNIAPPTAMTGKILMVDND